MAPEIVIAAYRPKEGREAELRDLLREHLPTLRRLRLVTGRPSILCLAPDGCHLEIFEWTSGDAAQQAHHLPEVARLWEAMAEVADFPALASVAGADARFPHFRPVDLEAAG